MGFYSIENAKTRLKSIENAKIRYDWVLYFLKCKNKVCLDIFFIENAEVRYYWGFLLLEILE